MSTFFGRLHRGVALVVSAAVTSALAVVAAPAVHADQNVPAEVNIRLSDADKASMTDKSYWWTNEAASHSWVKFVEAGTDLVLHYTVTEASSDIAVSGATLTLNAGGNGNFTGSLSATTDENGQATFTLHSTQSVESAEPRPVAPSTMSYWADGRGGFPEIKYDLSPTVGATVEHVDRVWTHTVKPESAPAATEANIRLSDADKASMTDKSYWWTNEAASKSLVKFVEAGSVLSLTYCASDMSGAVIEGETMTLKTGAINHASFTGSLTATTDANGCATFTLQNTTSNDNAEVRPVDPSTMSYWDDSRGALLNGFESTYNFEPTVGYSIEHVDRVWSHTVKAPVVLATPPAEANIRLSAADTAHMADKSYWWTNEAASHSWVKFVQAGDVLSLTYTVTDGDGNTIANLPVTLNCLGGSASFSGCTDGKVTGITNANGTVTFSVTSTTSDADAESRPVAPSSMDYWADSRTVSSEKTFNFEPTVGSATEHIDRVWTHTVKAPASNVIPVANIYLSAADKAHMVDKSYWWTNEAASHSMVKFVVAGDELVLHYRVTDADGNGIADKAVTLYSAAGGACFTGDNVGTTDANGYVTFTLTNCTVADWPHAEWAPVKPSTMYYWDDSRSVPNEVKYDFWPSVGASVEHIDRVWTHTVLPPAPAAPDAVGSISTTAGDRDISISFNAPYDGYSAITGYTVTVTRYSSKGASRVVGTYSLGADETSFDYDRAVNGVAYSFTVTATNANGTSDATSTDKVVAGVPDAPSIDNITAGNGKLTIEISGGDGGATAHTYYGYSLDGGQTWVNSRKNTKSVIVVKKLTNGETYSVRVRAFNKYGAGAASDAVDASPVADAPSAPKVSKFVTTSDSITVYFRAGYNGGADITDVEYTLDGGESWNSTGLTAGPFTIDGLDASTTYSVSVRAVNSTGSGAASAARSVTTRRG